MTADDCPDPGSCPVPDPTDVDLRRLRLAHLEPGRTLARVHPADHPAGRLNDRGRGDGRFSPLPGHRHAYAGDTRTVALLETCFHNVHQSAPRIIYTATDLVNNALSTVTVTDRTPLVDLRDDQLDRLGLDRRQLVATTPAHYPCTRQWAVLLLQRRIGGVTPAGLIWNSRVAELAQADSPLLDDLLATRTSQVAVIYDTPAFQQDEGPHYPTLVDGQGRLLIDLIAEQLDAHIV